MSVYHRVSWWTPKECDDVVSLFPPVKTGLVEGPSKARNNRSSFLGTGTDDGPLKHKLTEAIDRANLAVYRFDLNGMERLQLSEYENGEEYGWHLDIASERSLRKLSVVVQLSDPNDYDGGDLEFWGTGTADKKQGTLIAFPSYLLHRVTPVTRGVRRSLVAWAVGSSPFR